MHKWLFSILLVAFIHVNSTAQELFIYSDPASIIPKNSLLIRAKANLFDEYGITRTAGGVSVDYGLLNRLSINVSLAGSNHHGEYLPKDMINHRHVGGQTIYFTQHLPQTENFPFTVTGINASAKFNFLKIDNDHKHLRMAVTAIYSTSKSAHFEAEANLANDNAGIGGGLIATYLDDRMAFSFRYLYSIPESYEEDQEDGHLFHNHQILLDYGNTQEFNLSLGYLISPGELEDFTFSGTNLFIEFVGKKIQGMDIIYDYEQIAAESPAHMNSFYAEILPGIQKVFESKLSIEASIGLPFINSSFAHSTPYYLLSIRRLIFL